jgi:hypothetical protein
LLTVTLVSLAGIRRSSCGYHDRLKRWAAAVEEYMKEKDRSSSFSVWRADPKYMKEHMRPNFNWFETGGYRESKKPDRANSSRDI